MRPALEAVPEIVAAHLRWVRGKGRRLARIVVSLRTGRDLPHRLHTGAPESEGQTWRTGLVFLLAVERGLREPFRHACRPLARTESLALGSGSG